MLWEIKQGDTARALRVVLKDAGKRVVPLTGASVRFRMEPDEDSVGGTLERAVAVVGDPAAGTVEWLPEAGETDVAGLFRGEFRVTFGDGSVETFPGDGYISIHIRPRVATRRRSGLGDQGAAISSGV